VSDVAERQESMCGQIEFDAPNYNAFKSEFHVGRPVEFHWRNEDGSRTWIKGRVEWTRDRFVEVRTEKGMGRMSLEDDGTHEWLRIDTSRDYSVGEEVEFFAAGSWGPPRRWVPAVVTRVTSQAVYVRMEHGHGDANPMYTNESDQEPMVRKLTPERRIASLKERWDDATAKERAAREAYEAAASASF
jgi:hypothetical protein